VKRTVAEHQAWLKAERSGLPFVAWDDANGDQHLLMLGPDRVRVPIGRRADAEIAVTDDPQVSRVHAVLERVGIDWVVMDEGLSRNGTVVNGDRLSQRHRLANGDEVKVGRTVLHYVHLMPADDADTLTDAGSVVSRIDLITPQQRNVLAALSAPLRNDSSAAPATNAEIAAALGLSPDSVKAYLRSLFRTFGLSHLPQNSKRTHLAEIGARLGIGQG